MVSNSARHLLAAVHAVGPVLHRMLASVAFACYVISKIYKRKKLLGIFGVPLNGIVS